MKCRKADGTCFEDGKLEKDIVAEIYGYFIGADGDKIPKHDVLLENEKLCPYNRVTFSSIPGYIPGYGCPVCKGLSYHVPVVRG